MPSVPWVTKWIGVEGSGVMMPVARVNLRRPYRSVEIPTRHDVRTRPRALPVKFANNVSDRKVTIETRHFTIGFKTSVETSPAANRHLARDPRIARPTASILR